MLRRLSKREQRLILILVLAAVLAIVGFSAAPKESPTYEDLMAFYVDAFNDAKEITIRSATGDAQPVTLTRDEAAALCSRLSTFARYGSFSPGPSPYPAKYILDVTLQDGSRIKDISVGHHLDAPKQPLRGRVWLIPGTPGPSEPTPVMADAIDRYLNPEEADEKEPGGKAESD